MELPSRVPLEITFLKANGNWSDFFLLTVNFWILCHSRLLVVYLYDQFQFGYININYLHCGAPKTWYGVSSYATFHLERVVQFYIYNDEILPMEGEDRALNFLAEKTTMLPTKILPQRHVPVYKSVQMPTEFVITFPRACHVGFSHGKRFGTFKSLNRTWLIRITTKDIVQHNWFLTIVMFRL